MKTISYDFQGWPMNALTLWEILEKLGFKKEGNKVVGEISEDLLNAYPVLLEDDGMGYGVNQQYIIEVDKNNTYNNSELHIQYLICFVKSIDQI